MRSSCSVKQVDEPRSPIFQTFRYNCSQVQQNSGALLSIKVREQRLELFIGRLTMLTFPSIRIALTIGRLR